VENTSWNETSRKTFIDKCVEGSTKNMGADKANSYCSCMLEKIQAKYPVADSSANMTMAQMMDLAKDCLK
jgi:hypothetical protein